jgi:hypothetical protein
MALFDPIEAFADGVTSIWGRALLALSVMLGSVCFAASFGEYGIPEVEMLALFPLYLAVCSTDWGYLAVLSFPLLLFLIGLFVWCLRFEISMRSLSCFFLIPFLIISGPQWFELIENGPSYRWGWDLVSLIVFLGVSWFLCDTLLQRDRKTSERIFLKSVGLVIGLTVGWILTSVAGKWIWQKMIEWL